MSNSYKLILDDVSGITEYDLDAASAYEGVISITGTITSETSNRLVLLFHHFAKEQMNIKLFINSNGGEVNSGLLIYDLIRSYPYDIDIHCTGMAASMAAILLAGGKKGHRFILPHARVMIHEPLIANGFGGSATAIEQTAKDILEIKSNLNEILANHTGKSIDEISKATSYDNYMSADEAIDFGICDGYSHIFD